MKIYCIQNTFFQPGSRVVSCCRSVLPTVSDQAAALQLGGASQSLSAALGELRAAAGRAREACGASLELDAAVDAVSTLKEELVQIQLAAEEGQLRPLPGETVGILNGILCNLI